MKLIHFFAAMILFCNLFAQVPSIKWENAIGGTKLESCGGMTQTVDGRFLIVGSSYSQNGELSGVTGYGQGDVILFKMKNNGSLQWIKKFGGKKLDTGQDVVQTDDGNFVFVGVTYSNNFDVSGNHGVNDAWLVKVDAFTQNIIWQKCMGGTSTDQGLTLAKTEDHGFLIGGLSASINGDLTGVTNHGEYDYWVIKTDSVGGIIWSKCYGGSHQETCKSVCTISDGGYLAFGSTNSNDGDVIGKVDSTDNDDLFLLKLDLNGEIVWSRCIGGSGNDFAGGVIEDSDGNIVLSAYSVSTDNEFIGNHGGVTGYDAYAIKLDANGNTIWSKPLGGYMDDLCLSKPLQNSDSTYIFPCQSGSDDEFVSGAHFGWDFWIVELNLSGDIDWQYCYGGSYQEGPQTCALDLAGRPTFAGYTRSSDGDVTGYKGTNAYNDIWVVQLDVDDLKESAISVSKETQIFPNPFSNSLSIVFADNSQSLKKIFIYDMMGRIIYKTELSGSEALLETSNFPEGAYQVLIDQEGIQHFIKIVKN